ncbi:PREDICTED: pre-mRNA-splicing factor cwc22-like [Lupinus angustifolius]|uniref:pre-mRNA-splicing factor cwc22-like n=1 Tax=Lupinus angustifolius TaxID=3871 RepID=UPI00092EE424|nr:PREDICTED: pre-mRNA-splicing factor cwc22-like [Lupinus angustifolius]
MLIRIIQFQILKMELCIMLLECCSQERTYLRYYGLLGQRFCMINKVHQENFEKCFVQQYSMIHRLETNKLRNVAKFFAHLLGTDALPWHVLSYIHLTEEDTTSSSRIFIKILFQELSEHLGIRLLNERLNDPMVQESFESIFPKDKIIQRTHGSALISSPPLGLVVLLKTFGNI